MESLPPDSYWMRRAAMRQGVYDQLDSRMMRQLSRAYDEAHTEISAEIQRLIARYAKRWGLSHRDAMMILQEPTTPAEWRRLRKLVAALEDSPIKGSIEARLNAPGYRYRISNLEALRESANAICAKLGTKELELGRNVLEDVGKEAYMRTAYDMQHGMELGWNASGISERRLRLILRENWSGTRYSERVWGNTRKLSEKLNRSITTGMMAGKSHQRIVRELMHDFGVGKFAAERLVVTETAYVANQAELESYMDSGVEQYQFIAVFDEKTSEICRAHSSKVYRVEDAIPGKNFPPLHPWCRSNTIPVYGDDWLATLTRTVKDSKGKIVEIPGTWNYARWQEWQAAGCPPVERFEEKQQQEALERLAEARKADLRAHPEKALPGAESATAADRKFHSYLFNREKPDGWAKGIAFERNLGYNISNWNGLKTEILQAAKEYPADKTRANEHGNLYEQLAVIRGPNGRLANVKIGWIEQGQETRMTTAFIEGVRNRGS